MQIRVLQSQQEAIDSATLFLNEFSQKPSSYFEKKQNLLDAFEMIERQLSGYLSTPYEIKRELPDKTSRQKTFHLCMFEGFRKKYFPGGLTLNRGKAGIGPERDLITVLQTEVKTIPQLQNPEISILTIVGKPLALQLFEFRGNIFSRLNQLDQVWQKNIIANNQSIQNIVTYEPKSKDKSIIPKKQSDPPTQQNVAYASKNEDKSAASNPKKQVTPSEHAYQAYMRLSDISLARWNILSFFYYYDAGIKKASLKEGKPLPKP